MDTETVSPESPPPPPKWVSQCGEWISHRGVANKSIGFGRVVPTVIRQQLRRAARNPVLRFTGLDPPLDYSNGDLQHVSGERIQYYDLIPVRSPLPGAVGWMGFYIDLSEQGLDDLFSITVAG